VEVCGALVRGCLEGARAVLLLANANEFGGIAAVERSVWEMWSEMDYLLSSADPARNARKIQINALIEVIELLTERSAPQAMIDNNKNGLAKFEAAYPDIVKEVRGQRKKKRYHWTGGSRSKVIGSSSSAATSVYKMLSWETHPDVVSIRDIEAITDGNGGYLEFNATPDATAFVERSASATSECLLRAWNAFAQSFAQNLIDDAPPRVPSDGG
jgi:hypothetical protein